MTVRSWVVELVALCVLLQLVMVGLGWAWVRVWELGIVLGRLGLLGTGMPLVCGWAVSVFVLWMMW